MGLAWLGWLGSGLSELCGLCPCHCVWQCTRMDGVLNVYDGVHFVKGSGVGSDCGGGLRGQSCGHQIYLIIKYFCFLFGIIFLKKMIKLILAFGFEF